MNEMNEDRKLKHEDRLQVAIKFIRQKLLPYWDKEKSWKIILRKEWFEEDVDLVGECVREIRTIFIGEIPEEDEDLLDLLIHEICHCNASGHGKAWGRNMAKAISKARKLDLFDLEFCLIMDFDNYFNDRLP